MAAEPTVTVAIPVLDAGPGFAAVLEAVRGQELDAEVELVVADSGSRDGSAELARRHGARVVAVPPGEFSHGGTRNLLMAESSGAHVAFLTQDAEPADERWLARLLEGFALADDVALVFGPYRPRPGASHMVRRELDTWFASLAPNGRPHVDRGAAGTRRALFFSDANGCVARWAWERVPFRDVSYAEDRALAADVLAAGYAKAYHPAAAVVHSHDYTPLQLLRRSFDEWRALREVQGVVADAGPLKLGFAVQRHVRDDLASLRADGASGAGLGRGALQSLAYHSARAGGAALGSRAGKLPPGLRRRLSLEGRAGWGPPA